MKERVRLAVFRRDDCTCRYCGFRSTVIRYFDDAPMWCGGSRWRAVLHVDHMVPISRGGTDEMDNLATACTTCNLRKANKTAEEYFAWIYEAAA